MKLLNTYTNKQKDVIYIPKGAEVYKYNFKWRGIRISPVLSTSLLLLWVKGKTLTLVRGTKC